ncbi:MAG TPA: DUF2911 domain-containing protein [Bacteroidota bacterium]|nr:DUF2911 domain-containing protein [Bacteroidota bacterium]
MFKNIAVTLILLLDITTGALHAQQPVVDARDSVEIRMDGKRLVIEYGKPSMRGRKIMGSVVPYNRVWRTGSGKATTLTSTADFQLGDVEIPRGSYSLYTYPTPTQWKLIINKQTGQWGTTYNPDLDFARITVSARQLKTPVEHLTFKLERTNNLSAVLRIEWEYTSLSVPLKFLQDAFVASPRDSSVLVLRGKRVVVNYGRPSRRGRTIMGAVVPYGEVWRTGANEATTFTTEADLVVGGVEVPKGAYSLYTLPSPSVWKLIINKETGQWGTEYDRALDLARVNMKKETTPKMVERLTLQLEKTSEREGILTLMWERTKLSVRFSLKEN